MRSAVPPRQKAEKFRPPIVSLLFSGAWFYASYVFHFYGQRDIPWATFVSLLCSLLAIGQTVKALDDQLKVNAHRKKQARFKMKSKPHGESRFAKEQDLAKSKDFSKRKGIFLGTLPNKKNIPRDVFYDGEASILAVAPPGEGKTTNLVIPTILENLGQNLICNDPGGEAYALCEPALSAAGVNVVAITPFPNEVSSRIGRKVTDAGIDIFSSLSPTMEPASLRSHLARSMKWVAAGKPNMDEKSEFFYRSARSLGSFFALTDIIAGEKPTLPSIRRQLMQGPAELSEKFFEASDSTAFSGLYAELARSLGGTLAAAPQQFAGAFSVLEQCVDQYDAFSSLGRHTTGNGFDPSLLKHPTKRTAVFLISTLEMMETVSATTAMTLTYLFDSIAADTQSGSCTAIIDECGSLVMPKLASSLEFYRKANLRTFLIFQDLAGQIEKNFGKAAVKQILAACRYKIGLGLQEPETLEMFSKLCGTQSVQDMSLNDRAGLGDPMPDVTDGQSHKSVPLFRAEEIRTMRSDQLLVIGGNVRPIILNKVAYWQRSKWLKKAGPSPYYRG